MTKFNHDSSKIRDPLKQTIVVIGNGLVGHRFCQKLVGRDEGDQFEIGTFCEEPRGAYDPGGLTRFFD
ncbi:MAG: hypothetical protein H8D86_01840 [Planctomycetes bacterium]|nr:hypothetical protein [Planctomycetota bacterium]